MREFAEAAPGVLVATSRTMSTTSTVVANRSEALLIDPAWHPDELDGLADALAARDLVVTAGFATHAHHDHLLWHPRFGEVPRWASTGTTELATTERAVLVESLGAEFPSELAELMGRVTATENQIPADGLPLGVTAELIVHDGHAPGHTAVWLPESQVLVVGDMLSEREVPLPFGPDDLPSYLTALDLLAPYVARATLLIPGHGTPSGDPPGSLDRDRRYLDAVMHHRVPDDPRLGDPEMIEHYRHLVAMVNDRRG